MLAAAPLLGATAAHAAPPTTDTYTGGTGNWSGNSNWSLNAPPSANNIAVLTPTASGSVVVTLDVSTPNLSQFTIDATSGNSVTFSQAANTLNVSSDEVVGQSGGGSVLQSGGNNNIGGALQMAIGSNSVSNYTLTNGLLAISGGGEIIGNNGAANFIQSGGTHSINSALYLGFGTGASGHYSLTNGTMTVLGDEFIGNFGSGTFNQAGGTQTILTGLSIGAFSGSQGTMTLSGGSLSASNVYVGGSALGSGGTGNLIVSGGLLNVGSVLKVFSTAGNGLVLSGGTISTGSVDLSGNLSAFQWSTGTLQLNDPAGFTIGAGGPFGPLLNLTAGKSLVVVGPLTLNPGSVVAINGGAFTGNAVTNSGTINVVTGSSTLGSLTGTGNTTVGGGTGTAKVTLANFAQGAITINSGGTLQVLAATPTTRTRRPR